MRSRKKRNTSMLLLILLLTITLGYALLSTTLKINGITNVNSNTWDVRWDSESVNVTNGSVAANTPSVTESDTKVSFTAELEMPGDFYEFTIDAINAGTVDAMIDDIKLTIKDGNNQTTTLPSYILFSVKYNDGAPIQEKHLLAKRTDATHPTKEKYKVRIEFDPEAEVLPETDKTYNITYEVKYQQADGTAVSRNPYSDAGAGVYFDPVSSAQCDNTTYNQTAVDNGTSTCYKWNIIRYEGSNAVIQLDHDLITSEWASNEDYNVVKASSDVVNPKVSKLNEINTKTKSTKVVSGTHNNIGPYTAMKNLATATANWERVPLITNFSTTSTIKVASRTGVSSDYYVNDYETLTIQNGVYQTGNNEKTKITGVRARMITVDEIEELVEANNHTLSELHGTSIPSSNNEASFKLDSISNLNWLYTNQRPNHYLHYWMMNQGYDYDGAWTVCNYAYDIDSEHNGVVPWSNIAWYDVGIRPLITVPKKDIVIVK